MAKVRAAAAKERGEGGESENPEADEIISVHSSDSEIVASLVTPSDDS